jgi:pyrimidine deaminase RibD-like protein
MTAQKLELAILGAVGKVSVDEWVPCTVADLRNLMTQIDVEAANATINGIAEAVISLAQAGYLLAGKREDGGRRLPFDLQKQFDEGYISNFFARRGFELKLSHEGRKYISAGELRGRTEESEDRKFARLALDEARKSIPEDDGRPHPLVGAVVVKDGQVLATAHRGETRGNHAEYLALEKRLADAAVAGATVYTTLEPCTTRNHPKIPCVERLIDRKIRRVVIGMLDPDLRITGRGQRRLRSANIATDFFPPDLMAEVEELNRAFTRHCESIPGSEELIPRSLKI